MHYFHENWARVGFGQNLDDYSKNQPFVCDLTTNITAFGQPLDEAVTAANIILDTYPQPINILLSGGIDSQAMVEAFIKTGRNDFTVVCFEFKNDLNDYDVYWAKSHAEHFGYSLSIIPFDIVGFHETCLIDIARETNNHSPHIISHVGMIDSIEGTCVLAGNPIGRIENARYIDVPNYSLIGTMRYKSKPVVGQFFLFTPELVYSFLKLQTSFSEAYRDKAARYQAAGFSLVLPPKKYHGFERLKEHYDQFEDRVSKRTRRHFNAKYGSDRIYDHMFRHPLMDLIPYSEQTSARLSEI